MNRASLHDLSRTLRRHRAVLAALLTAGAVTAALPTFAPSPPATVRLVAAARDLLPGTPLVKADLTELAVPRADAPDGAVTDATTLIGRVLAGPVRRGETLTDVRMLGSGLLKDPGLVAAPVRLADGATVALLHAGDHVDVLAAPTSSQQQLASAVTVASNVQVLAVPGGQDTSGDGGLVVLAATPATAARLAAAAVASRLSVTVLAP